MISQQHQHGLVAGNAGAPLHRAPCRRLRWRAAVPLQGGQQQQQQQWGVAPQGPSSRRPMVGCAATSDTEISGYTPADYITYSEDPEHACRHAAEVVVAAPPDVCFALWNDWQRLVDFLDLIGQIGLDDKSPNMALFQCYYRWAKLPVMEITFLLQKEVAQEGRRIQFSSVWGMPLRGSMELEETSGGGGAPQTRVRLEFTHPMPNLLLDLKIGTFGVETHMQQILSENLGDFKAVAEAAAGGEAGGGRPQGALKAAAARGQEQRAAAGGGAGPSGRGAGAGAGAEPAAAAGEQRRSRAASAAGGGGNAAEEDGAAAAAAEPKRRGRTSRKTAAAAAAEPEEGGGAAPARRGRGTSRRTTAAGGGAAEGAAAGRRGRPPTSGAE